jgi:hypothetical protein
MVCAQETAFFQGLRRKFFGTGFNQSLRHGAAYWDGGEKRR